jgi:hypothetical protein
LLSIFSVTCVLSVRSKIDFLSEAEKNINCHLPFNCGETE